MKQSRYSRLLRITIEVKANPQQTIENLCHTLNVSRGQLYRDRDLLKEMGFQFSYSNGHFIIEKDAYLPVRNLAFTELLALTMAVRQLSAAGDFVLAYEALEAIKKMIANTEEGQREILTSCLDEIVLQQGFGCKRQVLDDLNQALLENRQTAIAYTRPTGETPKTHIVNPYQIYFKRRALYLDAFDTEAQKYLVFRINRISKVQPTQILFQRRADYNFAQRHQHAFSVFVGDSVERVRVRFAKRIAPFIREACWHHSQQLTEEQDGSLLFEVEVSDPREVGWWVLQWGADAEVLEPESLRQELRETAERLVGVYGNSQPNTERQ